MDHTINNIYNKLKIHYLEITNNSKIKENNKEHNYFILYENFMNIESNILNIKLDINKLRKIKQNISPENENIINKSFDLINIIDFKLKEIYLEFQKKKIIDDYNRIYLYHLDNFYWN